MAYLISLSIILVYPLIQDLLLNYLVREQKTHLILIMIMIEMVLDFNYTAIVITTEKWLL